MNNKSCNQAFVYYDTQDFARIKFDIVETSGIRKLVFIMKPSINLEESIQKKKYVQGDVFV